MFILAVDTKLYESPRAETRLTVYRPRRVSYAEFMRLLKFQKKFYGPALERWLENMRFWRTRKLRFLASTELISFVRGLLGELKDSERDGSNKISMF